MCSAFKRYLPSNHFKKDNAQRPEICFFIKLSAMSNFRRHVVGSPDIALHHLVFVGIKQSGNSEVCQFNLLVFSHQNVCRLQISMHYPTQVHHFHCISNLLEYFLSLLFGKWPVNF